MSDAIDAFLDSAPKADSGIDTFLDAGSNPGKSASKFKPYNPAEHSVISRLFMKYAPQELQDWAGGATGVMRGTANLIAPGQQTLNTIVTGEKPPGAGDKLFPTEGVDKNSWSYLAGQVTDPAALAIGGGVGRVVQAAPFVSRAAQTVNTARAAGQAVPRGAQLIGQVAAPGVIGGTTGAATGYLASEGNLEEAGMSGLYGLAGGVVIPSMFRLGANVVGGINDFVRGNLGTVRAARSARAAAGDQLPVIRGMLSNAPDNVTATQATVNANKPTWSALGEVARARDESGYYYNLANQQAVNRQGMLTNVTPNLAEAEARRAVNKNVMYPRAFNADEARRAAATVGPVQRELVVTNPSQGTGYYRPPQPLRPSVPPALAGIADEPIMQGAARDAADVIRTDPGIPEALRATLTSNPMESAQGLHAMKIAIDNQLQNPNTLSALGKYSQSSLKAIRRQLISAIGTFNPEYDAARTTFAQLSAPVNQSRVLTNLRETLAPTIPGGPERTSSWGNALGRGEESALRRSGLDIRFGDTADVLSQPQMQTVNEISRQVARDQILKGQVEAGSTALQSMDSKMRVPNMMNQTASTVNKFLEIANNFVNRDTYRALSEGMRNGQSALELINTLPTAERHRAYMAWIQAGQTAGNIGLPGAVVGTSEGK